MFISGRHVEPEDNAFILREDFLTFVTVQNAAGKNLDNIGQGYDEAFSMRGSFRGVEGVIWELHLEALYVHCSSHSLNLALSHSCRNHPIR